MTSCVNTPPSSRNSWSASSELSTSSSESGGSMLEQTADVVAREVGQPGVPDLVVEQWLALTPQALVAVHARAVVLEDRLRHERHRAAVLAGHGLHDVLEPHQVVRGLQQ